MKILAPISITTYHRLEHLKKTIESLKKNTLAKDSILYIFSDAPKSGDEEIVAKVREYIHTVDGFKEVRIVEQAVNNMKKNMNDARSIPLKEFGKMIRMEDDIVTAPGFLQFINDALEFYKDDEKILSIGGHTPNLKQLNYLNKDFYIIQRFHGWGYGIWESKFNLMKPLRDWESLKKDKLIKYKLDQVGTDLWDMVRLESLGIIDAGDVRLCHLASRKNFYNILPTQTLVRNIGLDGSGAHCGNNDIYEGDILSNKVNFTFSKEYSLDDKVRKEYKRFYDKPLLYERVINKMKNFIKGTI